MKKIIVLGAGLVGGVMAEDLSKDHDVTSVDISEKNLNNLKSKNIKKICLDVSESESLKNLIKEFDLVIGAVPGFMGYKMMQDVIEAKKNIVDISFYPEDPFGLDDLAKKNNVVAVMDCGVAPGMGNIIFGHQPSLAYFPALFFNICHQLPLSSTKFGQHMSPLVATKCCLNV